MPQQRGRGGDVRSIRPCLQGRMVAVSPLFSAPCCVLGLTPLPAVVWGPVHCAPTTTGCLFSLSLQLTREETPTGVEDIIEVFRYLGFLFAYLGFYRT